MNPVGNLFAVYNQDLMPADHVAYLEKLKSDGFEPKVIYDIGSAVLHWTRHAERLWPNAKIYLFDAFEITEMVYTNHKPEHEYNIGVLSDTKRTVKFYENQMSFGGNSYYREIGGPSGVFPAEHYREVTTQTLDDIIVERGWELPDLVKIDVQGAEKDVIAGGVKTLSQAQHLLVEMQRTEYNEGAPKVTETLPYIESLGWKCVAPLFCDNGPDGDYGFVRIKEL
jgi:FkbM family methyltransferase